MAEREPKPPANTQTTVYRTPRTQYVYVTDKNTGQTSRQVQRSYGPPQMRGIPPGAHLIFGSWVASMAIVAWDEWHNNNILPRPARLWYTSLTYLLLAGLSIFGPLAPLANALAVGYTIMLLWQLYNKTGQFGGAS